MRHGTGCIFGFATTNPNAWCVCVLVDADDPLIYRIARPQSRYYPDADRRPDFRSQPINCPRTENNWISRSPVPAIAGDLQLRVRPDQQPAQSVSTSKSSETELDSGEPDGLIKDKAKNRKDTLPPIYLILRPNRVHRAAGQQINRRKEE